MASQPELGLVKSLITWPIDMSLLPHLLETRDPLGCLPERRVEY
jgi:hypothetical protein